MTRRPKIAVTLIAVALALAAGFGVALALRPLTLKQRFDQLRDGMTYAEVVAILGRHDDQEIVFPSIFEWEDRGDRAIVNFSHDGTAHYKGFMPIERTGFLDRVLAWLGL
jgi:hypothetical protein